MPTEFNIRATLDESAIMPQLTNIRSQIGMALSSPTGFQDPSMGIAGSGAGAFSDFSGGAVSGFRQMMAGFSQGGFLGGAGFGGTFTNSNMAYTPHYGAIQANTSIAQEWQNHRYGLAAAEQMRPPGVSAANYFLAVEKNHIDRQMEARDQAASQARASFWTGVGGLAGGEAGAMLGGIAGGAAGSKIASRLFGSGAAGAGRFVGGLAGAFFAFDAASDYVGGRIQKHYAEIEQERGIIRELGEISGAGRNLSRSQRVELGIAAKGAAKDINMDVQEMGDILALSRQVGMLPSATDPSKAREQYRDFAKAVEEGAQILQTSLAGATAVIKSAVQAGMTAKEGIIKAAAAGGPEEFMAAQARARAFGAAGAATGLGMGYTAAQGSQMFTGSLGAVGGAGLTSDEMRMMGGRYGAAQFLGSAQMAAAKSPIGDLQLMAAMGGGELGGLMDLPGQALGAVSTPGDMIGFMVHRNELRRGIGSKGIRTMAMQQISAGGEMIQDLFEGVSERDAQRFFAENVLGMSNEQAKLYVGGVGRSGGGAGGTSEAHARGVARAAMAMQGTMLGREVGPAPTMRSGGGGFSFGDVLGGALTGGMIGSLVGGPITPITTVGGAIVGGGYSLIKQGLGGIGAAWDAIWGGGETAEKAERRMAAEYDRRIAAAKEKIGFIDVDETITTGFLRSDLGGVRLSADAVSGKAGQLTAGSLYAAGLRPVEAGAGTIEAGGQFWDATAAQRVANRLTAKRSLSAKDDQALNLVAYEGGFSQAASGRWNQRRREIFGGYVAEDPTGGSLDTEGRAELAATAQFAEGASIGEARQFLAHQYRAIAKGGQAGMVAATNIGQTLTPLINNVEDKRMRERLQKEYQQTGITGNLVFGFINKLAGGRLERAETEYITTLAGGAAAGASIIDMEDRRASWMQRTFIDRDMDPQGAADSMWGLLVTNQMPGRERMIQKRAMREITATPQWQQAVELAGKGGKTAEIQKLVDQARANVVVSNPEYQGYDPDLDVNQMVEVYAGGKKKSELLRGAAARIDQISRSLGGGGLSDKDINTLNMQAIELERKAPLKTVMEMEAKEGLPSIKRGGRGARKGAGTVSRKIGWGAREDAMSSIQRSLRHVERSLKAQQTQIEKISKGGES